MLGRVATILLFGSLSEENVETILWNRLRFKSPLQVKYSSYLRVTVKALESHSAN